uniref:Proline-rich nuclear receptor coactivator 2 n=1 Tax=Rhabditophanes sp. KR3021 TaxID=114890 RepID=A0AC35U3F8_9BILA
MTGNNQNVLSRKDKRVQNSGTYSPNSHQSDSSLSGASSSSTSSSSNKGHAKRNKNHSNSKRPQSLIVLPVSSSSTDSGMASPSRSTHSACSPTVGCSTSPQLPSKAKSTTFVNSSMINTPVSRNGNGSPKNSRCRERFNVSNTYYFAAPGVNGSPLPDKLPLPPTAWINDVARSTQTTPVTSATVSPASPPSTPISTSKIPTSRRKVMMEEKIINYNNTKAIRVNPFQLIAAVAAS